MNVTGTRTSKRLSHLAATALLAGLAASALAGLATPAHAGVDCDEFPDTPICDIQPALELPYGWLDSAAQVGLRTTTGGQVAVAGWAAADSAPEQPIDVRIVVDGTLATSVRADGYRPDVQVAYPHLGPNHGFTATLPMVKGPHRVCATAVNAMAQRADTGELNCRDITVAGPPVAPSISLIPSWDRVTVRWVDNANDETSNRLEKSADGAAWQPVALGSPSGANWTSVDTAVTPGTAYTYRITALNSSGPSAPASAGTTTLHPPVAAPSHVTLAKTGAGRATLRFLDNASAEDGFTIIRKASYPPLSGTTTATFPLAANPGTGTVVTTVGLLGGYRNCFTVSADRAGSASATSPSVCITG